MAYYSSSSNTNQGQAAFTLPPGYKFFPSEEILLDYLKHTIPDAHPGSKLPVHMIPTIDLYTMNPNQIPFDKFKDGVKGEWIFFTTRPSTDLVTQDGYWHPTTLPTEIKVENRIIGFKQIFTFHWGIAPEGQQSNFIIHEYRLNNIEVQTLVVCRVRNMETFTQDQDDWEDEDLEN